jgi:UrcA family protein
MLEIANNLRPIAAAIVIAAVGTAMLSPAAEAAEARTEARAVGYADLDLTRADGVRTLNRRVNAAMRGLCKVGYRWSITEAVAQRECLAGARAGAAPQVERAVAASRGRTLAAADR